MATNKKKQKAKQRRQRKRALSRRRKKRPSKGWDPRRDPLPKEILKEWQRARVDEAIRQRHGIPRPIISAKFKGKRHIFVGKSPFWGDWKTFPDFLFSYIRTILGEKWGTSELKKSFNEMHPILQWHVKACKFEKTLEIDKDGIYDAVPTGALSAYLLLAYDLYFVGHNNEIQTELVRRLKIKEQFQGARYELFAAATCIKAGFDIQFEDEKDKSKKHVEFIATHKPTGQKVCVEAKSRHREGILGASGVPKSENDIKVRVGGLLNDALKKGNVYPLVVFIDFNLPPNLANKVFKKTDISSEFKKLITNISKTYGDRDKFNIVICTNHPYHYGQDDHPYPNKATQAIVSQNPEISASHPQILIRIFDEAVKYGYIPNEFPKTRTIHEKAKTNIK